MGSPSTSPPRSCTTGMGLRFYQTRPVDQAAQRFPEGKHAEDAAGVDETYAGPELAWAAPQTVEEPAEGLGRVDGIEDDALETGQMQHGLELFRTDVCAPHPLIAVEHMDLAGRFHGQPVLHPRPLDHVGHVLADPRGFPRDGHADDVGGEPRHLTGHEKTSLTTPAEGGGGHRILGGRATP